MQLAEKNGLVSQWTLSTHVKHCYVFVLTLFYGPIAQKNRKKTRPAKWVSQIKKLHGFIKTNLISETMTETEDNKTEHKPKRVIEEEAGAK